MTHLLRRFCFFAGFLIWLPIFTQAQNLSEIPNPWAFLEKKEQSVEYIKSSRSDDVFPAAKYYIFELETSVASELLSAAPFENMRNFESNAIIPIPLGDGKMEYFRIAESPVFAPELAANFPEIKSYKAISENNSGRTGRISFSPEGFLGVFRSTKGDFYIERYRMGEENQYVLYFSKDVVLNDEARESLRCGFDDHAEELMEEFEGRSAVGVEYNTAGGDLLELRVYRMAIAATSAYSNQKGGTVESVMASFNEALNLLNHITENEVAIRFELIPNNNLLIWFSPFDEPFENINSGTGLLSQATPAITGAGVPLSAFDVGHVFTGGCNDVGGVVSGRACSPSKARGVTCHFSNNMSFVVSRVFAHEVGHQFGVAHSWNFCPGNDGQRASASAFEPGSGSTIMSYAGSCGSQNVAVNNDSYFHAGSIQEWIFFSRVLPDNQNCGERIFTGNTEPVVTLPYENDFYIPINTPFKLVAEATDEDGDALTYCWEQMDLGPETPLGEGRLTSPLFRTFPPVSAPHRYFPDISTIVQNGTDPTQQLPDNSRPLNFRCTVRDNNPVAGATVWADMRFNSTTSAGPFVVTSPSSAQTFRSGELIEVQWDVANTNNPPVNCHYVDILLSTNGGFSYPITLVERTPNTGSALVHLPDLTGTANRIKVKGSDNIFFNISRPNFRIEEAEEPGFIFRHQPGYGLICLPNEINVDFSLEPILGFSDTVRVEMVSELPENASLVDFPEFILPGSTGRFTIDMSETNLTEVYELTFILITENDTLERGVFFETVTNDFSALSTSLPENGASGVGQTIDFEWEPSPNAEIYEVEIATNPSFGSDYIIHRETVQNINQIQPDIFFPSNTLYYWRVRPINRCGLGGFTPTAVFQTITQSCTGFSAQDLPVNTPAANGARISSTINIDDDAEVTQLRIPRLEGLQSFVGDIGFTLISPSGTRVRLFTRRCANLSHYRLGFDDNSPIELGCPLNTGRIYQPQDPLSAFEGEPLEGVWAMEFERYSSGNAGRWDAWSMEVCANTSPAPLGFVNLDTLYAPPLERTGISRNLLRVENSSSDEKDIVYTLVETPSLGHLKLGEGLLEVGATFTQQDIRDGILRYRAHVEEEADDHFKFTVINDQLEWAGIEVFPIAIREDAISSVEDPASTSGLSVFPNPGNGIITLKTKAFSGQQINYQLIGADGRLIKSGEFTGSGSNNLDFSDAPSGLYFLELQSKNLKETVRLVIQ